MKNSVVLHGTLHGFREGQGTGTDTLEAKMAQNMARLAHKPLFEVFLDFHKAYNVFQTNISCSLSFSGM